MLHSWPDDSDKRRKVMASHAQVIERKDLGILFGALTDRGYTVVGPRVRQGAVVYEPLDSVEDLPAGVGSEQDGGIYRLTRRADEALFGYVNSPQSWRRHLQLPQQTLWHARRTDQGGFVVEPSAEEPPALALLGVRACELKAITVQDRVFDNGEYADRSYMARRRRLFVIAVHCTEPGGTCFCTSMNAGPRAESDFDLALTEQVSSGGHRFVTEAGSERGAELLADVPHRPATDPERKAAADAVKDAARRMGREMVPEVGALLERNLDHPRWDEVAGRCLSCANCTLVCPTCFCSTTEDLTALDGRSAERRRRWDSCFTVAHSYLHGGSIRRDARSRYRQWMTHKLSTWWGQFGTSGCVGCGRCITWCPVAIDITEEARAIRDTDGEKHQ